MMEINSYVQNLFFFPEYLEFENVHRFMFFFFFHSIVENNMKGTQTEIITELTDYQDFGH